MQDSTATGTCRHDTDQAEHQAIIARIDRVLEICGHAYDENRADHAAFRAELAANREDHVAFRAELVANREEHAAILRELAANREEHAAIRADIQQGFTQLGTQIEQLRSDVRIVSTGLAEMWRRITAHEEADSAMHGRVARLETRVGSLLTKSRGPE